MVVDSSALCAILFSEPERADFTRILENAELASISAPTLLEFETVAFRRLGLEGETRGRAIVDRFRIGIVAFDEVQERIAIQAFHLFGKGRHPAGLNLGDCFSYALAKHLGEPLLFKGDDFSKTDVTPAL